MYRFCLITLLALGCAATTPVAQADASDSPPPAATPRDPFEASLAALLAAQPAWTASASVSASGGYKDNLLLSHSDPDRSGFSRLGIETLLWHVPRNNIDYFGFLNADYTRYFSRATDSAGHSFNHEAEAFAGLEWRYRPSGDLSLAFDGQGYYLDQVFDISETEVRRVVEDLKVHGGKIGPTLHIGFLHWFWIEATGTYDRQKFQDGLNDARIREGSLRLAWQPLDRFELSVVGSDSRRNFDTRPRYDATGAVDTGILVIHERELEGRVVAGWGQRKHWKTTTRAGVLQYRDNDAGFLNYDDRHVAQEIEWTAGKWLVHAEGEARHKGYEVQWVAAGVQRLPLVREEYTAELRVEREVSKRWTIFAQYDWERAHSNDQVFDVPIASYRMNEGLLGARWSWEK